MGSGFSFSDLEHYLLGILSGRVFTMIVLLPLVTTFMTGPLLSLSTFEQKQLLKENYYG